ncbi:hypothetical protein BKA81DRAFT_204125 [Phyllosticta paracitricarpa]
MSASRSSLQELPSPSLRTDTCRLPVHFAAAAAAAAPIPAGDSIAFLALASNRRLIFFFGFFFFLRHRVVCSPFLFLPLAGFQPLTHQVHLWRSPSSCSLGVRPLQHPEYAMTHRSMRPETSNFALDLDFASTSTSPSTSTSTSPRTSTSPSTSTLTSTST